MIETNLKIDFYTTSNSFAPYNEGAKGEEGINRFYHHKNLDPKKNLWGEGKTIYVRNKDGRDYVIKFKEDGKDIPKDNPNHKWKFRAEYIIIEDFDRNKEKARNISVKLKKEVLKNQNNKCWLCNEEFNDDNPYEIDHIVEWSLGGLTTKDNLQALCSDSCHAIKTLALKKGKKDSEIEQDWSKIDYKKGNEFLGSVIIKLKNMVLKSV